MLIRQTPTDALLDRLPSMTVGDTLDLKQRCPHIDVKVTRLNLCCTDCAQAVPFTDHRHAKFLLVIVIDRIITDSTPALKPTPEPAVYPSPEPTACPSVKPVG